jgi:ribosomal protein L32E
MSKLGKGRKKKQKWRKPKGRDTQMRLMRKGNPKIVKIGYKKKPKVKETVIRNIKDIEKIKKGEKITLGKFGKKKKLEIIDKIKNKQIEIINLNVEKFLKQVKKEKERKKKAKEEKEKAGKKKEKKAKVKEEKVEKKTDEKKEEKPAEKVKGEKK